MGSCGEDEAPAADFLPYSADLASSLAYLENWASPYLSRSAYETLKSRGLSIITDPEVRSSVVRLYENVYVDLVNDSDRSEWVNYEVSMIPLMLRVVGSARETRPNRSTTFRSWMIASFEPHSCARRRSGRAPSGMRRLPLRRLPRCDRVSRGRRPEGPDSRFTPSTRRVLSDTVWEVGAHGLNRGP